MATTALSGDREVSRRWPASLARCLIIALTVVAAGCDLPGRPNRKDRPVPADQVLNFTALYGQNCSGCHGADGKLGAAPPLNDELFRALIPATEIESVLNNGRHKTLMPAFAKEHGGTMTATQIQVLVHEIKGVPYKVIAKEKENVASGPKIRFRNALSFYQCSHVEWEEGYGTHDCLRRIRED